MIRIAVQKSGKLTDESLKLIKECGIQINYSNNKLKTTSSNFPLEILFLRDDDIPGYVEDNIADLGIVGNNIIEEKAKKVKIIKPLGFSKCRLSIAVPKNADYKGVKYLQDKNIATSYPAILARFLKSKNIRASIHEISGSVEIAPSIGLADAIFDIVSSGSTLISNGLKEAETVLFSEAVLISNKNLINEKQKILDDLLFRIESVQKAKGYRYILFNLPDNKIENAIKILPGLKSPTILPLAEKGWSSLHSVIHEDDFWNIIGKLKKVGAQGILIVPIEKMVI
ncbi:MAG: ATP phosphoribosyltransferase [Bacteroidales bacterium]|nr:ATP phosphoribosyltransferase [Bacteroidales bacterium]